MTDAATLHPDLLPMLDCPKWQQCSAPLCPLDREMGSRGKTIDGSKDGGVKERRCTLPTATRLVLGSDLPALGLFPKELAAYKQWENASDAERIEKLRQLASRRTK